MSKSTYKRLSAQLPEFKELLDNYHRLYHSVNELMAVIGSKGQVISRHHTVTKVMDVLHDIDGGVYDEED